MTESAPPPGALPAPVAPAAPAELPRRLRLATVWLAGCSGCHMSFLDLDEWLFDLAARADLVYSPVASDRKRYPDDVDVCLVEGAVANRDNLELALAVRARTRLVVSFGDCAISANVPGLRNLCAAPGETARAALERGYVELADRGAGLPHAPGIVPELLAKVLPLHEVIPVDVYLPGCPPSAERIRSALETLLEGALPRLVGPDQLRFG
jgi:NAD-reducing hydrogenase small subunit